MNLVHFLLKTYIVLKPNKRREIYEWGLYKTGGGWFIEFE